MRIFGKSRINIIKHFVFLMSICLAFGAFGAFANEKFVIESPNGLIKLTFSVNKGVAQYQVFYDRIELIKPSRLGFKFQSQANMLTNFVVESSDISEVNEPWQKVWGQSKTVENHYRQLKVVLSESVEFPRRLSLYFRIFDDGLGFRYEFPEQESLSVFAITSEETEFALTDNHTTWWTPADYDSYEHLYQKTPLSQITAVNTPITMKSEKGVFLSIHEAALTDYAGMTLIKKNGQALRLTSDLVPWPDGIKVKGKTPFKTPWRTIQIAKRAGDLIGSNLIENLNEPNVLTDTSWIKPMKYIGIWWGMHMRKYTWESGPKHGATTENTKSYIDFAKQHGIGGVLVEGWNQGWETWHTGLNVQNFTKAYEDFDLAEVVEYGRKNNVALIGHHETGGNIPMYEKQMEAAFKLYHEVGVHAVKTGYAGKMHPEGVFHHGQQMVNHYRKVLELAAKYRIMVNAHEPIKPTGIRRTYPNMMTREGGRGMEWNGWSEGNSPEHTVTIPFTRLLAGPMDYTPGIFNIKFDPQDQYRVHSTFAKQLAMFVVLYSPMQMAADMIENYYDQPAFEFIEAVPTTWDETKVLHGEIGDFITIARRTGSQWFIGSMTDERPRTVDVSLDFLEENTSYIVRAFSDAMTTDFQDSPTELEINELIVNKGDQLTIAMASGGGHAFYLTPAKKGVDFQGVNVAQHNEIARKKNLKFEQGKKYGEITKVSHLAVGKDIRLLSEYDQGYAAGGNKALIDGVIGGSDYKTLWQGYRKKDLAVVIDLGKLTKVSSIEIGFLQSILHSIMIPTQVTFSQSEDGEHFSLLGKEAYVTQEGIVDYQQKRFNVSFKPRQTRYIKVEANNMSVLPQWHIRPGQEAFIFADEIIVK